jgi:hypothetical protein
MDKKKEIARFHLRLDANEWISEDAVKKCLAEHIGELLK